MIDLVGLAGNAHRWATTLASFGSWLPENNKMRASQTLGIPGASGGRADGEEFELSLIEGMRWCKEV